ncbi:MAG: RHS repeat-associated core domain-containing protein [Actinomycetales bacterium]|nr:RHS repeat-associated core domain-containing protein [Actinomycetales bacterium]
MRTPQLGGPGPALKLAYNSAEIDGRVSSSNNQSTWVGEGFDVTAVSYIERSYAPCDDDGQKDKYDLCWKNDNASLVLNGSSNELVKDDTTGVWRLKKDDGSKVERLTGALNGARGGEHWQLTTSDGTRFVFGLNALPGADADTRTDSVWTVPVFGDDAGEPCHGDSFGASSCTQAWRWNLDYVVDTHGNASTYWYARETNKYAKNGDADPGASYVRGGYLTRIDYGQRASSLFNAKPGARVVFSVKERCLAGGDSCAELKESTRNYWPDVPFDVVCTGDKVCTGMTAPSFFTRKRLVGVTTQVWDAAASAFRQVDTWTMKQLYLDPGDTGDATDQVLWLESVQHANEVDGTVAMPAVRFSHRFLQNRVDAEGDDLLALNRPRIYTITTETGAVVTVTYSDPGCSASSTKPAPDANTSRCYPVYWNPNGVTDPTLGWFHKYVVTQVSTSDPTGGAETMTTAYSYAGGGAWHFADDPITRLKHRTWSQWRGYGKVTAVSGKAAEGPRSQTTTIYLRGMDGDRQSDGTTRSVSVTGVKAPAAVDRDQYAGFARETIVYDGAGGAEVSGTWSGLWSKQTAAHDYGSYTARAFYTRNAGTRDRTTITATDGTTSSRTRTKVTSYDTTYGMVTSVEDQGDISRTGDESCARTWYARNPAKGLTSLVSRVQTLATTCDDTAVAAAVLPTTSATSGNVISDVATAYDTTTWSASQTPTIGEARWTGRASKYAADGTPTWQTTTSTGYDGLGRVTTVTDAVGAKTTTVYTPAAAWPMTGTAVTNALGHLTTTTFDPAWGQAIRVVDANRKITSTRYDALGRLSGVWLANVNGNTSYTPNTSFSYHVSATAASWVSMSRMGRDPSYPRIVSYTLYDALLRERQTQTPSPRGGRVITEKFYNSRGLVERVYTDVYDNTTTPNGTLVETVNAQAPSETVTAYDGAGRPTTSALVVYGVQKWSTTTSYTGNSVATSAPTGGSATREFTDALGRVTEHREYRSTSPASTTFTSTTSSYDKLGRLAKLTGPDASWTHTYDLFGRKVREADPDKGTTTTTYTVMDQVATATDATGKKLLYSYDTLGRTTGLWSGSKTDATLLASWTYDTAAKGQPGTATRYVGGKSGKAYSNEIVAYDDLYEVFRRAVNLPTDDPLVAAGVPSRLRFETTHYLDGSVNYSTEPAAGGLAEEALSPTYNSLGMPRTLTGTTGLVLDTQYSPLGDTQQVTLGIDSTSTKKVYVTNSYEPGTRRLTRQSVKDTTNAWMASDLAYTYDHAGNVRSTSDTATMGGAGKADHQCFSYDGYRRLTNAWTPSTAGCSTENRTVATLGGAAPYWSTFSYNNAGLRTKEVTHATAGETTTTYTYGSTYTHRLSKTTTTKPDGTSTSASYTYDATGNTLTRPGVQGTQTLTWDAEGRMAANAEPAKGTAAARNTSYVYDADGSLLIRRPTSGDGETVLYLGATEVRMTVKSGVTTVSGRRTYSFNGMTIGVRTATSGTTGTKLTWLAGDRHGTASVMIDATTQAVTKRYSLPFGGPRGTKVTWVDDKGFLGKPMDAASALTHVGAREYDPKIGRFLSVDPILDIGKTQSLNGYSYAEHNPGTFADPTGLATDGVYCGGNPSCIGAVNSTGGSVNDYTGDPLGPPSTTKPDTPTVTTCSANMSDDSPSYPTVYTAPQFHQPWNPLSPYYNPYWEIAGDTVDSTVLAWGLTVSAGKVPINLATVNLQDKRMAVDNSYKKGTIPAHRGDKVSHADAAVERKQALERVKKLNKSWYGRLVQNKWVGRISKPLAVVGTAVTYAKYYTRGESGWETFGHGSVEVVTSVGIGAAAGVMCGPAAPLCAPVGAYAGSEIGEWANEEFFGSEEL